MKKLVLTVFALFLFAVKAHCGGGYPILRDIGTFTRGTLDNARLDPSSVTLQGNNLSISSINAAVSALGISTQAIRDQLLVMPTTYALTDLVITTNSSNFNLVVASAAFIDIMGAYATNVGTTADISKAGVGGLDTGTEQPNTWYKIFLISGSANVGIILSTGSTSNLVGPTMPTGYTKWRHIGWIRNDGSSNLIPIIKKGNFVSLWKQRQMAEIADESATYSFLDMQGFVSPGAKFINAHMRFAPSGNGTYCSSIYSDGIDYNVADNNEGRQFCNSNGLAGSGQTFTEKFPMPLTSKGVWHADITGTTEWIFWLLSYEETN